MIVCLIDHVQASVFAKQVFEDVVFFLDKFLEVSAHGSVVSFFIRMEHIDQLWSFPLEAGQGSFELFTAFLGMVRVTFDEE